MKLELERSGWANLLNVVNYLCRGKKVTLKISKRGQHFTWAENEPFFSIETYLGNATPIVAVILGGSKQLTTSYFVKNPTKIVLTESRRHIKEVSIRSKEGKEILIDLSSDQEIPREVIYHLDVAKFPSPMVDSKGS